MSTHWILLFVLISVILIARIAKPAINQRGNEIHPPVAWKEMPVSNGGVLKVATYNVQTGKNLIGDTDITRSSKVITQADIVGIQEVYAPGWLNRFGFGISQTESLAIPNGFGWLFCATRYRWFREHRGNAVLSKVPIQKWHVSMLPSQSNKGSRNMTVAKFEWQGETIHIINTHLHTAKGREQQLKIVLDELLKYPRSILIGDFNSRPNDPILIEFFASYNIVDAISKAGLNNLDGQRIDWIITKGFNVVDGEMQEKGVSDHPYYQVSLMLN